MKNQPQIYYFLILMLLLINGCGGSNSTGENPTQPLMDGQQNAGSRPWIGDWIQVNFLAVDDNGVWDTDIPSGIGFTASISENSWVDFEDGCAVTFNYIVGTDLSFSKNAIAVSEACPFQLTPLLDYSGTLQFGEGNVFMYEYFDLRPSDDLTAFKWLRQ